jgi:hypothetical protein
MISDVPLDVLVHILSLVQYDYHVAQVLMRVDKRFHKAVLYDGVLARRILKNILARAPSEHTGLPYIQLNVDTILHLVPHDSDSGTGLRAALGVAIMEIARNEGTLRDSLLVRAPLIKRVADSHKNGDPTARAARHLFDVLRPAIVATIMSERVGTRYVYADTSDADMERVVDGIGRLAFTNRLGDVSRTDTAFRRTVAAYIEECAAPFRDRAILAASGPMCFWDTSDLEDMRGVFDSQCFGFGGQPDESDAYDFSADLMWPTQNAVHMGYMFAFSRFNGRVGHLNVARVKSMAGTFCCNHAFNQPIGGWDVSRVSDASYMFHRALAFDQPIGTWDVARVVDMHGMFEHAAAFNRPIGAWDVRRATNMNRLFKGASSFAQPLGGWCNFCGGCVFCGGEPPRGGHFSIYYT